ncbi:hypothetical protein OHA63_32065 [Streptomyces anulatus]|uniref:hypothetical protein n=1 Tax=Streptomyces anulatus TaxID=1892 RepID=UPI002E37A311|nr:hypothetical protein [Streptomyces anulatus]
MSHRVRVSHILGVVLALSLSACGSAADKDPAPAVPGSVSAGSPAGGDAADVGAPEDCPDKHAATVADDKFGGTADIDLCARPEVHLTAVSVAWADVYDRPAGAHLNIMPVTCTGDSEDSCKVVEGAAGPDLCNQAKPDCHPQRGEEIPVLCYVVDKLNSDRLYYGVLLESKRLLAMGTDHDRSYTKDFTDKGDIPVGYVEAEHVAKAPGGLPVCDGGLLHGAGARLLGQLQGLPIR